MDNGRSFPDATLTESSNRNNNEIFCNNKNETSNVFAKPKPSTSNNHTSNNANVNEAPSISGVATSAVSILPPWGDNNRAFPQRMSNMNHHQSQHNNYGYKPQLLRQITAATEQNNSQYNDNNHKRDLIGTEDDNNNGSRPVKQRKIFETSSARTSDGNSDSIVYPGSNNDGHVKVKNEDNKEKVIVPQKSCLKKSTTFGGGASSMPPPMQATSSSVIGQKKSRWGPSIGSQAANMTMNNSIATSNEVKVKAESMMMPPPAVQMPKKSCLKQSDDFGIKNKMAPPPSRGSEVQMKSTQHKATNGSEMGSTQMDVDTQSSLVLPTAPTARTQQKANDSGMATPIDVDAESSLVLPTTAHTTLKGLKSADDKKKSAEDEEVLNQKVSAASTKLKPKSNDAKQKSGDKEEIIDLSSSTQTLTSQQTHVIFAIDFSSSMNTADVRTGKKKIKRWNAVFDCVDTLLTQQLQQQQQELSTCLISALIFNDDSENILNRTPLGDGNKVRNVLSKAKKNLTPKGGTGFSAGFKQAEILARSNAEDSVLLVFLSDGRPGDLPVAPPHGIQNMQTTFRRKKQTYPAAGVHIESMQKRHKDFNLQLICLFNEGAPWLKYLARRYNGTFHNPDLTLDDDTAVAQQASGGNANNHADDDEVEVVNVRSADTVRRERRKASDVVSLTQATNGSTSIRSTFSSISATVTALRSGTKLQERKVAIKAESVMITYEATRMQLTTDINGVDKFSLAPGEKPNERKITVSMNPFAQGGLRNVYRMKQRGEQRQVAKESRHDIHYNERLKFHVETVKCQTEAATYADNFNKQIKKKRNNNASLASVPRINVLAAEVYRLKSASSPGGFRYLAVEQELKGEYEKYNNNDGWVNQSDCVKCQVAQAFSHFTYESSNQQKMVVDIQGASIGSISSMCMYTDPQIHSVEKAFGRADRGINGFKSFFRTHKCNHLCRELGLPTRSSSSL